MSLPDLGGLLGALHDAGVRYVAIGALAVAAHGRVRATEDVDLVPDPADDNLRRLADLLTHLDARLTLDPDHRFGPEERTALARGGSLSLTTSLGELDLVQRLPGIPAFSDLDAEAVDAQLLEVPVRVCSRKHLLAMKRVRGSAQDLADLEALEQR
jgi:hypothetical protein